MITLLSRDGSDVMSSCSEEDRENSNFAGRRKISFILFSLCKRAPLTVFSSVPGKTS